MEASQGQAYPRPILAEEDSEDERDIKGDGEGWACDCEGEREVCGGGGREFL
jgi:hypothetical protein